MLPEVKIDPDTFGGWHPEAALQITLIGRELTRELTGADQKTDLHK